MRPDLIARATLAKTATKRPCDHTYFSVDVSRWPALAPRVTHAGTFNGNPTMAVAGLATMGALTPAVFADLAALGQYARDGLARITAGMPLQVTGAGSRFKVTATGPTVHASPDAATS